MKENLLVVGRGQYGILVSEIARSTKMFGKIDFADDNDPCAICKISEAGGLVGKYSSAVIAIGNPKIRAELFWQFRRYGFKMPSIISPMAYVSPSAKISGGCVIEPMATVQSGAELAFSCFISSSAVIRHNAKLGEFCHADCGSIVMSNISVPELTKITALTKYK